MIRVLSLLLLLAAAPAAVRGQECPGGRPGADALWKAAKDVELQDEPASKIVYNEPVDFGQGTLRTYARLTGPCDPPAAIGVEMSASLQDGLPGPTEVKVRPPPECEATPTLPVCFPPFEPIFLPFFDEEAPGWSPFRLAEIDWSPLGHHPPGVYNTPHWDLHFYLINQTQIEAITPGPCTGLSVESYAAAHEPVPSQCFPSDGFANINAVAPLMGNHYVKMDAPEMVAFATEGNGVPAWNETWIWGSDAGKITFFEVMVKRAYLLREPSFCSPIPGLPSEFAIAGYKPSTYCIVSTDNATMVELRDFKWYAAGCKGNDYAPASYMTLPPGSPPLSAECDAVVPKMAGAITGAVPTPAPVQAYSSAEASPPLLSRLLTAVAALLVLAAALA
jgi:hypothetical protein